MADESPGFDGCMRALDEMSAELRKITADINGSINATYRWHSDLRVLIMLMGASWLLAVPIGLWLAHFLR